MKILYILNEKKFFHEFQEEITPDSLWCRLGMKKGGFCGYLRKTGFSLYRQKGGFFSLFALTLHGRFYTDGNKSLLEYYVSRSRILTVIFVLWSLLMLYAGMLLIKDSALLSLFFFLPPVAVAIPFFCYSKKEKALLTEKLLSLGTEELR